MPPGLRRERTSPLACRRGLQERLIESRRRLTAPKETLGASLPEHGLGTQTLSPWALRQPASLARRGHRIGETALSCVGLSKPSPEKQRDRVLTEDEIRAVWTACDADTGIITDAFRLMLVTAQRRGEVLSMRWQDVDGSWWTIPAELAKNGLAHRVPLSRQGVAILDRLRERANGPWVFPSPTMDRPIENPQKGAERVRERSKVPDLRLHDLRRTAASPMTGMGISRLTVKKTLNHAERDVTAVYDRHSYDPEKRSALEAWGRRLEAVVSGTKGCENIVALEAKSAMTAITMEFPDDLLSAMRLSPTEFGRELRLAAAARWYGHGRISQERAAQVAGLTRGQFLAEPARRKSDAFVVDFEDLRRELNLG